MSHPGSPTPESPEQSLEREIAGAPGEPAAYLALAHRLELQGRIADATRVYARLAAAVPGYPLAHFNLACGLRKLGQNEPALAAHRRALELRIERPEEVWSNIGVILGDLHRHAEARESFGRALEINPRWIPALYNLALLLEESGDREGANELFERVLAIDPDWHEARARRAHLRRIEDPADPLIAELERTLARRDLDALDRESLQFALAKALDDCDQHAEAFAQFHAANEASRARIPRYNPDAAAALFQRIREGFTPAWLAASTPASTRPVLLICGMFRSGSTLLEQMLALHPAVTAGGELDWFNSQLMRRDPSWPERVTTAPAATVTAFGNAYLEYLAQRFPGAGLVSDKRPDNFLYLGLARAMFPGLRVLHTVRDPRDTCLSIYFQQLGGVLSYACDLADTAHYLREYRALMHHWQGLMPESILDVDYTRLVTEPEPVLRQVCDFLEIAWDPRMLGFPDAEGRVRTASLWQVREPLNARAIGRWRNYEAHLGALGDLLDEDPARGS